MEAGQLTALVTATANALSCRLGDKELSFLAAILVQLGDTLATIVTQRSLKE